MQQSQFTPKKRGWIYPAIAVPFLGVMALMVAAGNGQVLPPPSQATQQTVDVMALERQSEYRQQHLAYGRVEATKQARLGFELAGTIEDLPVDEGQRVAKGEVLGMLDTARLNAQKRELQAGLARAQADARLARLSEDRVADLVRKNLESDQRLDEVREATKAADAAVDEISARISSLQVELDKSVLLAPFDAVVLSRPEDPGSVVAAGQTVFTLQEAGRLEVRIALSEDDAFAMSVGARHSLRKGQQDVLGVIKSIGGQRALTTRTVDVIFALQPTDGVLPGDLLAFSYDKPIVETGYWIPRESLNSGVRGLWTLFTVDGVGQKTLSSRVVEVLYSEPERVYVRGALDADELLVVSGTQRLVPDQIVNVRMSPNGAIARGQ